VADVSALIGAAGAVYFAYHAGKAIEQVRQEEREEDAAAAGRSRDPLVPDALTVDMDDVKQMVELCILRARQIVVCANCGFSPLPCGLQTAFVDPATGDNIGVLAGVCPECETLNTGKMDQHYMAMIAATYEWDRSALRRDLLEMQSVSQITVEVEDLED
jgi:hypothetical protein